MKRTSDRQERHRHERYVTQPYATNVGLLLMRMDGNNGDTAVFF